MLPWQRKHIVKNRPHLIDYTLVNEQLLAELHANKLLSSEDVSWLKSVLTRFEKANMLYEILQTRTTGYKGLIQALERTNQTAAVQLLLQKDHDRPKESLTSVVNPFNTRTVFSERSIRSNEKLILVSTIDSDLTKLKIESVFEDVVFVNAEQLALPLYLFHTLHNFFRIPHIPETVVVFFLKATTSDEIVTIKTLKRCLENIRNSWEPSAMLNVFIAIELNKSTIDKCCGDTAETFDFCKNNIQVVEDHFTWNQIDPTSCSAILDNIVYDQGRPVTLRSFCWSYYYNSQDQIYDIICKGKFLVDMIRYEKPPVLFRQTIPVPKSGYIRRKLRTRCQVREAIFDSADHENILAVMESDSTDEFELFLDELGVKFTRVWKYLKIGNDTSTLKKRILLTRNEEEVKELALAENVSVHWLKFTNHRPPWVQTMGRTDFIHKHLCNDIEQTVLRDEEFRVSTNNFRNLVICDSAGMGKSVLLAKLAEETQKVLKRLVLYFVMPDFIQAVKKKYDSEPRDIDHHLKALMKVIQKSASEYQIGILLSDELLLPSKAKLEVFPDGLDEVNKDLMGFAFKCLGVLRQGLPNLKLLVTARPHLLVPLENCLSTIGYNIMPFDVEDQLEFLNKFWSHDRKVLDKPINKIRLDSFANRCLDSIRVGLSSMEKDIAGVPLQCLLIAEVFEAEAELCADPEHTEVNLGDFGISTLGELFEKMIQKKLHVYERRYLRPNQKLCIDYVEHLHIYLAIKTLYSETEWPSKLQAYFLNEACFIALNKVFLDWKASKAEFYDGSLPYHDIQKLGILEHKGDDDQQPDMQFLHRTFAEYFVAKFSMMQIMRDSPCSDFLIKFISEAVLETFKANVDKNADGHQIHFKFPVVCQFFNIILQSQKPTEHDAEWFVSHCINWRLMAFASATEVCIELLKVLRAKISELCTSEQHKLLGLVNNPSDLKFFIQRPKFSLALLRVAAERGDKNMMDEVLSKRGVLNKLKSISELLHVVKACATNSAHQDVAVFEVKINMLNFLITAEVGPENLPIFAANIHFEIFRLLLSHIKSRQLVEMKDGEDKTVLHKAAEYMPAPDYVKLISYLEQSDKLLIQMLSVCRDRFGQTPLHAVLRSLEPSEYVLEALSQIRENQTDDTNHNVVWIALRYQQKFESIRRVVDFAKNHKMSLVDKFCRNILHIAAQHRQVDVLKELLNFEEFNACINEVDIYGNIPVFHAFHNSSPVGIIRILHVHGADLSRQNKKGAALLHLAAELGNHKIIELLSQLTRSNLFVNDFQGNNPMHFVFLSSAGDRLETFRNLETYSESLKSKNNRNQCPLLYGLTRRCPDISLCVLKEAINKISNWSDSYSFHTNRFLSNLSQDEKTCNEILIKSIKELLISKLCN